MTRLAYVRIGIDRGLDLPDGRYVIAPDGSTHDDSAVGELSARASGDVLDLRRVEAASGKPLAAKAGGHRADSGGPEHTIATIVRAATPLDRRGAAAALEQWRTDADDLARWVDAALAVVNRAVRAHRLVWRDPYLIELTHEDLWLARVGHAPPEDVAAGTAGEEVDALTTASRRRVSSTDRARPGEVIGLVLGGRLPMLEGEELLLFAVREINHGRLRGATAALQAGARLLVDELGRESVDGAAIGELMRTAGGGSAAALLATITAIEDLLDGWRSGRDDDELRLPPPRSVARGAV
ncbi:hypothetical protein [Patulibacter defluvii]|uniref:hypothetical protein n=1 Tax=Patulibacter defluvii TaxID=3095358 RepID=UPI002A74EE84|nr:hypothetical protein [Patulibacter sp. DM4]